MENFYIEKVAEGPSLCLGGKWGRKEGPSACVLAAPCLLQRAPSLLPLSEPTLTHSLGSSLTTPPSQALPRRLGTPSFGPLWLFIYIFHSDLFIATFLPQTMNSLKAGIIYSFSI